MRRKGIFSETSIYFYLHNEHDRDVIEQVKILKEKRKLNALVVRLLKDHFESERQNLISDLREKYEFLDSADALEGLITDNKDFIDSLSKPT